MCLAMLREKDFPLSSPVYRFIEPRLRAARGSLCIVPAGLSVDQNQALIPWISSGQMAHNILLLARTTPLEKVKAAAHAQSILYRFQSKADQDQAGCWKKLFGAAV